MLFDMGVLSLNQIFLATHGKNEKFVNSIIFWQQELLWFSPVPVRPFNELFCCFHGQDMKSSPREDEMR